MCNSHPESIDHLFLTCDFAKECWSVVPDIPLISDQQFQDWIAGLLKNLDCERLKLVTVVCWKIWEARNNVVWHNKRSSAVNIVAKAGTFLDAWNSVHNAIVVTSRPAETVRWKKPPLGYLKCNVDAANDFNNRKTGIGCIIRDDKGSFVAALQTQIEGSYHPKTAEAIAVREALKWIKILHYQSILVESDALLVINGLKDLSCITSFDLILDDIRNLAIDLIDVSFLFAKRSANMAAHLLAREAMFNADRKEWRTAPPSILFSVLVDDLV
ncbi:PREDICTED: uncharacterized protein LOC109155154 [Ipomoea nil]|uniref:uncharacterized protein LOC109155154 n=1 Tax=Ipomoea nil TaxID=35883 RepID=UPI000901F2A6|nr:PREDICTED: uncharacterized protein LOC109155154 [Ipomoea nil]